MPPRWPRKPDRNDPAYRRLEDRINFALHVAIFLAFNSGLWFFQLLLHPWQRVPWVTGLWLLGLMGHGTYVFAIATYASSSASAPDTHAPGTSDSDSAPVPDPASAPESLEPELTPPPQSTE